jgi:glutaconate CoA-transferase, subunit B
VREHTGWAARFASGLTETPAPTVEELGALRDLNERTARAHGIAAAE